MVANLSFAAVLFHALYLFWIRSAVAQSPVDRDQLSMRNCHDRSLTSPPELHSLESPLEKRFLVRRSSPSRLRQGCPQPAVALSCSSAFSLAGAIIVARLGDSSAVCDVKCARLGASASHKPIMSTRRARGKKEPSVITFPDGPKNRRSN